MAYRIQIDEQGYDDTRFEGRVREDLLCSICQGVLRNPRTCQNREHPFCLACISQHLHNSHTCPECREHLTPETLKIPRFLNNILSELKIKCDYTERGCPEYVQLGNLQNHVELCDFAPVVCGNEGCGMVVNKRDKETHERQLCQPQCHNCKDIIKKSQDEIKKFQSEMKVRIEEIERKQDEMKINNDKIKDSQEQMKMELNEMKNTITRIERKQENIKDREELNEIKDKITAMERKQDQTMVPKQKNKSQVDLFLVPNAKVDPIPELHFQGPFAEVVTSTINLHNPNDKKVCFKVKSTAPFKYCVRPKNGIVEPLCTVSVDVMLQPHFYAKEEPKHKFMVQWTIAVGKTENVENILKKAKSDQIMLSKLDCVFDLADE